jgi:hypothetical protein
MSQRVMESPQSCLASFIKLSMLQHLGAATVCRLFRPAENRTRLDSRKKKTKEPYSLCLLAACLSLAVVATGQINPGKPSFSAYDTHEYDTINMQNLNVSINVPVMNKSGAFPFQYSLSADFYVFYEGVVWEPSALAYYSPYLSGSANGVLATSILPITPYYTTTVSTTCAGGSPATTKYMNWVLPTADGTLHPLPTGDYTDSQGCLNASFTDQTIDGSGYTVSVTKATVNSIYDRSGLSIVAATSITDSNGNTATVNNSTGVFTDTLGVTALTVSGTPATASYTWTDVNSGSPAVTTTATTGLTIHTVVNPL